MTWISDEAIDRLRDVATRPTLASDRYIILRPIGRGGMGAVYAAHDTQLDRDVALKVSNATSAASGLERRLEQEARVLARLEHPGIVPVHDAGLLDDGRVFYVMKLVQGQTLEEHAATLTNEAAKLGVFERIAETVAFAHAAGVVHRDLKPSNVMVGRFGEVLVLDWGVAKVVDGAGRRKKAEGESQEPEARGQKPEARSHAATDGTADGVRIGTTGFMAPEQASGQAAAAGPAADVYALGAVLTWLLADEQRIPRRLRAVVDKCLSAAPEARYPNASALVDDLARYRQGAPVSAHRETLFERAGLWFARYRTFIVLVLAYLFMRTVLALW